MKIKRLIAGGLSAAAGITMLLGSVFGAVTFSDGMGTAFFEKTDSTYKSPLVVIGEDAAIIDVIGATDLAAGFVSNYAVTERSVPSAGATLTVTGGGTDLATTATKLYLDDAISSAKQVLTAEDLPVILKGGTFEDEDDEEYNYEQYIYLGSSSDRKVTFGTSDEDIDPDVYLDMGTSTTNYLYATKVVFDTAVNFSSPDVHGNDIYLFNSKYTVASTSTNAAIVLFGSSAKETINAGESKSVLFGGTEYTIEVMGIQDQTTAIVKVDGESEEITEGAEETVGGLTFYVDTVIKWDAQTGEGYAGYVQLSLGSQKIILDDSEAVQIGEDEEDIDGTLVALTGTDEVSVIEIKVAAEDTDYEYLLPGDAFEDPVWSTFQVEFHGIAPAEGSEENREDIEFGSSGDYAKVKFTTNKGDTKEIDFAYSATTSADLKHSKEKIHVVEGAEIDEDEYVVVDAGGFAHLFLVDNIEKAGSSKGEVKLKDVFSGKTYEITIPVGGNAQTNKTIDGQTYYLNISEAENLRITWKFNASDTAVNADPGAYQTIFPALETSYGALVALAENVTYTADEVNFSGTVVNYLLPGGFICGDTCTKAGVTYTITNVSVSVVDSVDASVIVIEEEDINDDQNSIIVSTDYDSTDDEVQLKEPVLSAGRSDNSNNFIVLETDDDIYKLVDLYGTFVTWNDADKNSADVSYPNDQAIVGIGIGADPEFSVGGGVGGTYDAAIPITNPITKFDTEVTADSTLTKNLVLVGGPCVNDLVETLLNEYWNTSDSCTYWLSDDDLKTAGKGMIKIVEDAFGSEKKALIVAGTSGTDTRNLIANKVIKPTVYEGLTGSEYIGAV